MKKKDWKRIAIAYGEVIDRRSNDIRNLQVYQANMVEEHIQELSGKRAMSELLKETIPRWIQAYSADQASLWAEVHTSNAFLDFKKIRKIMERQNNQVKELTKLCSDVLKPTEKR